VSQKRGGTGRGGGLGDPLFLTGAVVVALGASVKLPAILALGFVGMEAARRRGGRMRDVAAAAAVLGAVTAVVIVALAVGTGLGFGWIGTQGTANVIRSWMSLATDLGQLSGQIGILAGLGDHTDTVLTITRGLGGIVAALLCLRLLLLVLRGRLDPVTGVGVGLGAVVLLGPVVHPWYLLWAAIPLAATRGMPRHRRAALAASALLAVMLPPTGADFAFRSFQLPLAILAGIVILLVALLIVRRELRAAQPSGEALPLDGAVPRKPASLAVARGEQASIGDAAAATRPQPASARPNVAGPPSPTGPRAPT
jgi:alpha-1,6-mannosyltransferase